MYSYTQESNPSVRVPGLSLHTLLLYNSRAAGSFQRPYFLKSHLRHTNNYSPTVPYSRCFIVLLVTMESIVMAFTIKKDKRINKLFMHKIIVAINVGTNKMSIVTACRLLPHF